MTSRNFEIQPLNIQPDLLSCGFLPNSEPRPISPDAQRCINNIRWIIDKLHQQMIEGSADLPKFPDELSEYKGRIGLARLEIHQVILRSQRPLPSNN